MRQPLPPAVFLAFVLAANPPASAEFAIDTSSPDRVMASLAELHERWTFSQFAEFTRAVAVLAMPAQFESAVLSEDRRAGGLTEGLALLYISLLDLPLALERDPFASRVSPERLHEGLEQVLRGRPVRDIVHAGRNREQAFLPLLEELYLSRVRELAEELENAEAEANSSGEHQDRRDLDRLRRNLARTSDFADRIRRRLNELERAGSFEPGAVECRLEEGIDLSTDEAMMADLEALAETCPQQRLIQFLRAAAFASVVPVGLAAPGARMDPAVVQELRVKLAFASRAIAELGLYLQEDLVPPDDSVPKRLRTILRNALAKRSVAEVRSDGEKAEGSFLPRLHAHLTQELEAEIRSETGQEGTAPRRPSARIRELRLDIERIDRRLATLGAEAPTTPPPGAN